MLDIGRIIENARVRAGLSQRELARRARTSQPAVARLEAGGSSPTLATLERLIEAAGFVLRLEVVPGPTADLTVDAYKRDVDRTLLRDNLGKSIDARLRKLEGARAGIEELRAGARVARARARRERR